MGECDYCGRTTKGGYKVCFKCWEENSHDCPECGKRTSDEYDLCYTCNNQDMHPCEKCKKPTKSDYKMCWKCHQEQFEEQKAFSDRAHLVAAKTFYPLIYPNCNIKFEEIMPDEHRKILDEHCGVDRIAAITEPKIIKGHVYPIRVSIQERFSDIKFKIHRAITVTEWKTNSNTPAELYTGHFQIFVHGFYDDAQKIIHDLVAVSWPTLFQQLVAKTINFKYQHNDYSHRSYLVISHDELRRIGAIIYEAPGAWK